MAAALLQRYNKAQIQSAGIDAAGGFPPTRHAVSVMKELGFDIGSHMSQDIKNLDLAEFDLLLAMTPYIADQLRKAGAEKAKIKELNILDPYDKGLDVYRSTVNEIQDQLRSLLGQIEGCPSQR